MRTPLLFLALAAVLSSVVTSTRPSTGRAAVGLDPSSTSPGGIHVSVDVECPAGMSTCVFAGPAVAPDEEGAAKVGAGRASLVLDAGSRARNVVLPAIGAILTAMILALAAGMAAFFFSGLTEPPMLPEAVEADEGGSSGGLLRSRASSSASLTGGVGAGMGGRERKGSLGG
jgi:hypothetical protein